MISLAEKIDALLPQTQCTQCGYKGCEPYAAAIARGDADINQCPPGGEGLIRSLALLLQRDFIPLNRRHGETKPRAIAIIDENICIGCALCIKACPVDAIVGAAKQMHTVISAECTGCELCLAPCPVDCISMRPPATSDEVPANPGLWRRRYDFRLLRVARDKLEKETRLSQRTAKAPAENTSGSQASLPASQSSAVAAALRRARVRQSAAKK
ncbi:MAG: electron transport complex subunit RsxB [Burkholderiales bacterium]